MTVVGPAGVDGAGVETGGLLMGPDTPGTKVNGGRLKNQDSVEAAFAEEAVTVLVPMADEKVMTDVLRAGQSVTVSAQEVTVLSCVVYRVTIEDGGGAGAEVV